MKIAIQTHKSADTVATFASWSLFAAQPVLHALYALEFNHIYVMIMCRDQTNDNQIPPGRFWLFQLRRWQSAD